MGRYEDLLKAMEGKGEEISFGIKKLEPGEVLIGKLLSVSEVTFKEEGEKRASKVNGYLFETDNGNEQVVLGSAMDTQLEGKFPIGRIYVITFKGKIPIKGGKTCNTYKVVMLPEEKPEEEKKK